MCVEHSSEGDVLLLFVQEPSAQGGGHTSGMGDSKTSATAATAGKDAGQAEPEYTGMGRTRDLLVRMLVHIIGDCHAMPITLIIFHDVPPFAAERTHCRPLLPARSPGSAVR